MAGVEPNVVNAQWLMDELHPNGRGHDEMARLLFKQLSIFDPTQFTGKDHWSSINQ
jgi:lysophospholipase L1-like esterase